MLFLFITSASSLYPPILDVSRDLDETRQRLHDSRVISRQHVVWIQNKLENAFIVIRLARALVFPNVVGGNVDERVRELLFRHLHPRVFWRAPRGRILVCAHAVAVLFFPKSEPRGNEIADHVASRNGVSREIGHLFFRRENNEPNRDRS